VALTTLQAELKRKINLEKKFRPQETI
jgi:hypothetical protein